MTAIFKKPRAVKADRGEKVDRGAPAVKAEPKPPKVPKPPRPGGNRTGIKNGPTAQKPGPKTASYDWEVIAKMYAVMCSTAEVAAIMGCSDTTLRRHCQKDLGIPFDEFVEMHRATGRKSLRHAQFASAVDAKNVQMQIWLGKQVLGQKDQHEVQGQVNHVVTHESLLQSIERRQKEFLLVDGPVVVEGSVVDGPTVVEGEVIVDGLEVDIDAACDDGKDADDLDLDEDFDDMFGSEDEEDADDWCS